MKFRESLATLCSVLPLVAYGLWTTPAQATEAQKNIESLIAAHKWMEASHSIFREASAVDPKELSIAKNLAKAGFLGDAISSAQLQFPVVRTPLLVEISKTAPSLSHARKIELVGMAFENSRTDSGQNYLRSGDLALLSFVLMEADQELKAKSTYEEAISVATKGLNEKGSGGYRRISELLAAADLKLVRDWMIAPLIKLIDSTPDPFNAAFTYLDLARLQHRLNQRDAAKGMLSAGVTAAGKINASVSKLAAVDQLTEFSLEMGEIEFAERYGNRNRLLPSYVLFEAERGNRQKALELISQLQNGLYVGRKSETQSRLVSNAVKRRDLDAAVFYAERLTGCPPSVEATAWTHIAELQVTQGQREKAQTSYARARDSMREKREHEYFSFEILATLALGKSMFQNGFVQDGHRVISETIQQMRTIPRRRIEDLISVQAKIAMALGSMGRTTEATNLVSEAYHEAHVFPQDKLFAQMTQARLLSEIALVTAMLKIEKIK